MRHFNELFFPCLESPLRFYLSIKDDSNPSEEEEEEEEDVESSTSTSRLSSRYYLNLSPTTKEVCLVKDKPHEFCLMWPSQEDDDEEEDDDNNESGVSKSSFVIQSMEYRKLYLTCDSEGKLGCCDKFMTQEESEREQISFHWAFEYDDSSGMVVHLINTTFERRVSIFQNDQGKTPHPICTTTLLEEEKKVVDDKNVVHGGGPKWKITFLSGELCFLNNAVIDRRLRCDVFGKLNFTDNWKGWEVWRFVECGQGELQLVSWTHEKVLTSYKNGTVGTTSDREAPETKWRVSKYHQSSDDDTTPGGVLIQSVVHGRYLCAVTQTELATVDAQDFAFAGVSWQLEAANSQIFYLSSSSHSRTFLSSRGNGQVCTAKYGGKGGEQWKIEAVAHQDNPGKEKAFFTIRSCKHKKYLGSSGIGEVYTTEILTDAEYWELDKSPNEGEGYIIVSYLHNDRQLSCNAEGQLLTSPNECQGWQLQACLPGSISKNQMLVAGLGAAALMAVSPISLAFGAAAATTGAEVLATEALASGIGTSAVGISGAEALAASAFGVGTAVVGTSAAIIVVDHKRRLQKSNTQKNQHPIQSINRPLAAWRSW